MPALKCTRKLIKALGKSADRLFVTKQDSEDASVLGDWTAHLVIFARIRFVLFVNDKTLLSIFIHLVPKEYLFERFQQALFKELLRLEIPADKATEEALKFQAFSLEENTDRSMRGYLNQMAFEYKFFLSAHIEEHGTFDPEAAQALTNQSPHVKRKHSFPEYYARELFGAGGKPAKQHG
jgi:hypothetical protein